MILDLYVQKEVDGYSAKIVNLEGMETWAHSEEEAIDKILDLLLFYFNIGDKKEIKVDRVSKRGSKLHYKIIFGRTHERVFD